jgi:hypothetical protein
MMQEIRIRELSRPSVREWTPPIGAMGGPPAHELYRDLVLYADFRLLRDEHGEPSVSLRDGERRRTFRVPSDDLREAIDRFRMRRSLRAVPEAELAELTRIIQARATDPDAKIPLVGAETRPAPPRIEPLPSSPPTAPEEAPVVAKNPDQELESILGEIDEVRRAVSMRPPTSKAPSAWTEVVNSGLPAIAPRPSARHSISGGQMAASASGLPRYLEVLRNLIRNGGWVGTTSELSNLTGEEPRQVVASLLGLRSELAKNNIVVASVETKDGWRWLAVDRNRLDSNSGGGPPGPSSSPP